MAKPKYMEKYILYTEGFLDVEESGNINIEVDQVGVKNLAEMLKKYNGCNVKITVDFSKEE